MSKTPKQLMEEKRAAWHKTRANVEAVKRELVVLFGKLRAADMENAEAHQAYKDAKELWRVSRDYNLQDLDQARMVLKLRDGGA